MTFLYNLYNSNFYITDNLVGTVFYKEFRSKIIFNGKKYITDINTRRIMEIGTDGESYECYLIGGE